MNEVSNKQIEKLAKEISKAGKIIAKDSIAKEFVVFGDGDRDSIVVKSDSGFEAIIIGSIAISKNGYMYLYYKNTSKMDSFPNVKELTSLLSSVIKKEKLKVGEGFASYFDWDEYGGMDKQFEYFSNLLIEIINKNFK